MMKGCGKKLKRYRKSCGPYLTQHRLYCKHCGALYSTYMYIIFCCIPSKAFDCVDWQKLWDVLSELGVPEHFTALLQALQLDNQGKVKIGQTLLKPFQFKKGFRQGCILSPILFNVYGEYIMRCVCEDWESGISIGGLKITNLRYPDDTTVFAAMEGEMSELLE